MLQTKQGVHQNQYLSSPIKSVGIQFQVISRNLIKDLSDNCGVFCFGFFFHSCFSLCSCKNVDWAECMCSALVVECKRRAQGSVSTCPSPWAHMVSPCPRPFTGLDTPRDQCALLQRAAGDTGAAWWLHEYFYNQI